VLGSSVRNNVEATLERDKGGNVDDLAVRLVGLARLAGDAAAGLEHVLAGVTGNLEDGVEVDLEDLVPVIVGEDLDRVTALDTTAVDHNVEDVALGDDTGDELGH
jgi:hypothetical protein